LHFGVADARVTEGVRKWQAEKARDEQQDVENAGCKHGSTQATGS